VQSTPDMMPILKLVQEPCDRKRTHRKSIISECRTNFVLLVQLLFTADHVLHKVQRLQNMFQRCSEILALLCYSVYIFRTVFTLSVLFPLVKSGLFS